MSILMKGADVAAAMKEDLMAETERLKKRNITPKLTIIRIGAQPDDMAYERAARKKMESVGVDCSVMELPEQIRQKEFEETFQTVNGDDEVHGILLFRPLPAHLSEESVKAMIHPIKDVDCMGTINTAKVFAGDESGYAPCTPEAVLEVLDYYNVSLAGKKAVVIGRSMVVGRPLAMLLLKRHATVTLCHTRTKELLETCSEAEVLVAAAGKAGMVTGNMIGDGAVVVDVGINVDEGGHLCGDVNFEEAEKKAAYISPVPRGVGSVTSSVLAKHVVRAAKHINGIE